VASGRSARLPHRESSGRELCPLPSAQKGGSDRERVGDTGRPRRAEAVLDPVKYRTRDPGWSSALGTSKQSFGDVPVPPPSGEKQASASSSRTKTVWKRTSSFQLLKPRPYCRGAVQGRRSGPFCWGFLRPKGSPFITGGAIGVPIGGPAGGATSRNRRRVCLGLSVLYTGLMKVVKVASRSAIAM